MVYMVKFSTDPTMTKLRKFGIKELDECISSIYVLHQLVLLWSISWISLLKPMHQ